MLPVSIASVLVVTFLSLLLLHALSSKLVALLRWRKLWLVPASIGTPVHELSHAIAALVLGHKIHRVQLFSPQPDGGLGFVEHSHKLGGIGLITTALISLAPIAGGIAAIYALTLLLYPTALDLSQVQSGVAPGDFLVVSLEHTKLIWGDQWAIQHWLWLAVVTSITAFMAPSPGDYKNALPGLLITVFIVLLVAAIIPGVEQFIVERAIQLATSLIPVLAVVVASLVIAISILLVSNAILSAIKRS